MSYEIGKTFKFEAAHCLKHHDGKCSRPHGHSYIFELIVESSTLRLSGHAAGMVDDYTFISEVGGWIEDMFDHQDLNEVLDDDTVTAESLSSIIFEFARSRLPNLVEVRVKETAKTFSSYRPQRAADARLRDLGRWAMDKIRDRLYGGIDTSDPNSCWMWDRSTDKDGYGYFQDKAIACSTKAHRASAWLAGDTIEGMVVLHTCDTPGCINPGHLVTGTHADNEADKDAKGRRPSGEWHGAAKLTEAQAREVWLRIKTDEPRREIACAYGMSVSLINAMASGRVWRNVTNLPRPEDR